MKEIKLTKELIKKVMSTFKETKPQKMKRLMDYLLINPQASLVQTAGHLGLPVSSVCEMKTELIEILKELE